MHRHTQTPSDQTRRNITSERLRVRLLAQPEQVRLRSTQLNLPLGTLGQRIPPSRCRILPALLRQLSRSRRCFVFLLLRLIVEIGSVTVRGVG